MDLVVARPEGLYCPPGDFHIDPWRPVARAVITHAHSDHARAGSGHYLCAAPGRGVLLSRLPDIHLDSLDYGQAILHNGVRISLHPAGHVLGSAQVRLEHRGQVWVASGDYKLAHDGTCAPFEPVRCDTFITESTFGLPIYRWQSQAELMAQILSWWRANAEQGRASVLYCYAFGKAQRILHGLMTQAGEAGLPGPIVEHGAMTALNRAYAAAGVALPATMHASELPARSPLLRHALVIAPPSAQRSPWLRRFGDASQAFASGWMRIRGTRRRRGVDRGFVISDHADWPGLHAAIEATGAQRVFVTHGYVHAMVRYLCESGLQAQGFETQYGDEEDHDRDEPDGAPGASGQGGATGQAAKAANGEMEPNADANADGKAGAVSAGTREAS
ncbi:ligase-associated DNA damage response exonuclease [Cupriavidus gilardii]|uniref:ligase-associated DNA damage response exonuclease n=1 Tax=Cupriavidus gilardii TaxID=82541 RepID=UPI0021B38395|nr:ligase-associated DNA damage response exonuclease [Cupriavidus gilardii]UXC38369.1 ligase-associated DNA damage response exonuclease [Cupriavidus gilardii]